MEMEFRGNAEDGSPGGQCAKIATLGATILCSGVAQKPRHVPGHFGFTFPSSPCKYLQAAAAIFLDTSIATVA